MSKKKALIKETVVRRWGKLANIHPLTETFIDNTDLFEQEEDEELGGEDMEAGAEDMEAGAGDMDMDVDAAAPADEPAAAVDKLVNAVVDAIQEEFPEVDMEIEGSAAPEDEGGEVELDMGDGEAGEADPAGRDMAYMKDDAYNRKDEEEEELNLEVLDDEELTEAVLKRVVERLLRRK